MLRILGLALVLRVVLVLATPDFAPYSDAADYDEIARSIAAGDGYPLTVYGTPGSASALRPPAWPVLLAGVFAVAHSYLLARLVAAALGVVAVWLVYVIARELWDERVARIAALIAAVFPPLIVLNASLMSEALFVALELGAVAACLRLRRSERPVILGCLVGALCAAAALTRSVGLLLPVVLLIGVWTSSRPRRDRALATAAVLAAVVVVLTPWTIRNARTLHAFVPVSTQTGPTVAGTYNTEAGRHGEGFAVWRVSLWLPEFQPLLRGRLNEAQIDRELRRRARRYAARHPGYVPAVVGINSLRLFDLGPGHSPTTRVSYREMGIPDRLRRVTTGSLWLVAMLAVAGAAFLRRARPTRTPWFVWLVPLSLYGSVVWAQGQPRLRAGIDPFLVLLAAWGVAGFADLIRRRRALPPAG